MIIVGENEEKNKSVSIRKRHKGNLGEQSIDEFIKNITSEIKSRRRK